MTHKKNIHGTAVCLAALLSVTGSLAAQAQAAATAQQQQMAPPPSAAALAPAPGMPGYAVPANSPAAAAAASAIPVTGAPAAPSAAGSAPAALTNTAAAPAAATTGGATPAAAAGAGTAPAAGAPAGAAPTAAEMAIVQNATVLNSMAPVTPAGAAGGGGQGLKVTDILTQPAVIRPLPEKYLIVKKEKDANDADSRLTAARVALWQGHYQAALELFDDLYKKNPRDIRIAMGRAVALQKLGQTDQALSAYQEALSTDPKNVEALTNMLGLIKGQDTQTAVTKLLQLREMYPANADVTAQLGMVYGVAGDYENAVKYLDMAEALKPGRAIVLYNKAVAYDRMGRTFEAAELYRKIVRMASDGQLDQQFPVESVRKRLAVLR